MANLKGQIINGYEFLERIAYGNPQMTVYLAQHRRNRRKVIIRVVQNTSEAARRYEIEARIIARFKHPHIIAIHDYWRDADMAYLVTRWMQGDSLDKALQKGCWDVPTTLQLLERIAEPLALLHENNLIHCNLRPAAIVLDKNNNAHLSDFSQAIDFRRYQPGSTTLFAPAYAAPEQWLGLAITPQTDIYSLGVIIFEMLTGENPFAGSLIAKLKHLNEALPALATYRDDLSPALDRVLQQATAKNSTERYATATDFCQAFREATLERANGLTSQQLPMGGFGETQPVMRPTDFAPGLFIGSTLGGYQVEEFITRGGMGEVYKGSQIALERPVAIKILPHEYANDPVSRVRFEREARVVASLNHPGIVQVFDYGSANGTFYIVMQLIEGRSLAQYLTEWGALSPDDALPFILNIADALDYAHDQGLVHRDVKPSNIMLQKIHMKTVTGRLRPYPYQPILLDFGITKLDTDLHRFTTGAMGTFSYMAPEQFSAAKDVTRAADIYALGVMAYQMLTGKLPFNGEPAQVMFSHLNVSPTDPRHLVPQIPDHLSEAIMRALAKDPTERFATAGQFAETLERR